MTFKPLKPYQPWYDDERDYNTNAPSYYDYLANSVNLEKVQTDAINELLVRDVNFQDSDEIHVDKLTNWHSDDDTKHGEITFKAHVITSPSSTTQTIDGVDYVAPNGISVLHDGIYSPNYKKVLEKFSTDSNSKFTKLTSDVNNLNTSVNSLNTKLDETNANIATKQDKLTATSGVKLNDNTLTLDSIDGFEGDLNTLKKTCWVKPSDAAPNLPTGANGNGILTVTRIGDVVQQTYTLFDNKKTFIRTARNVGKPNEKWFEWCTLVDTVKLDTAIKNVNRTFNLQNPDIYKFHKFSINTNLVSGDWGFEFFNDTNAKIYNIKVKVGTIVDSGKDSIIAQQNVSDLLSNGVPQDFIEKAKNEYVFRAGYYLADTLKRIAFGLKTEKNIMNLTIKYYDDDGANITNTRVVQGHECAPIAVPYNNAISIEETGELRPVVDSTEE